MQNLNRIIPKFGRMLKRGRTEPSRSLRPNIRPMFGLNRTLVHLYPRTYAAYWYVCLVIPKVRHVAPRGTCGKMLLHFIVSCLYTILTGLKATMLPWTVLSSSVSSLPVFTCGTTHTCSDNMPDPLQPCYVYAVLSSVRTLCLTQMPLACHPWLHQLLQVALSDALVPSLPCLLPQLRFL